MKVVLLGAGGTGTSFAIASRLRANWGRNIKLIVTDIFDESLVTTSLIADKFYKVPYASDPSFSPTLSDIVLAEGVQTYIPILNDEIILASQFLKDNRFSHVDFWSSETHALCTDKKFADGWLKQIGVRTPKTINLQQIADGAGPWFSKPRNGSGSRGAQIVTSADLRILHPNVANELLVQELCKKPEVTVDSFYDASTDVGHAYCRERLETKSGVCTKARLFADAELSNFAAIIGKSLGQRGTICFQAMRNDGGWAVTDLNLRAGAGTAMTCSAGFDVLSAAFACRNGEDYSRFLRPVENSEEFFITRQYSEFVMRRTS